MTATETLRKDHEQIKRLEKVISKCYQALYDGKEIPFSDIEKITIIISEFLDSIHYSREENSYFPCVASYDSLKKEIRTFLIEHEFGRRIARQISKHLQRWKNGVDAREPVARFLRTYSIYLNDHISKEEHFFDQAEKTILSKEEEQEMYEQFKSVMSITKKINEMIKEIDLLEQRQWFKNQ
ncbi:MAG TPA: hemerythrin domain-containing protein [Nitrosopumilaceae archaeon]|nr:hemerythrin domain-containing protein [Nitrosopumilaceae archaeon]